MSSTTIPTRMRRGIMSQIRMRWWDTSIVVHYPVASSHFDDMVEGKASLSSLAFGIVVLWLGTSLG